MPGLDKSRFVNLREDLEDEFTCGICHEIFCRPVVVPCCRQTYCDDCIREWLRGNSNCPNDRQPLNPHSLYPAPIIMVNILNSFQIHCDYWSDGCQQIISVENLATHLTTRCEFNPERKCQDCGGYKDQASAHSCIQNLYVMTKSAGESTRDLLPVMVGLREDFDTHKEVNQIELASLKSQMDILRNNDLEYKAKVESLSTSVTTLIDKVSKLEEIIHSLRGTTVPIAGPSDPSE